jgi:hypothetical protein
MVLYSYALAGLSTSLRSAANLRAAADKTSFLLLTLLLGSPKFLWQIY